MSMAPRPQKGPAASSADRELLTLQIRSLDQYYPSCPRFSSPDQLLSVSDQFFLECLQAMRPFALANLMARVPALRPWGTHGRCSIRILAGLPVLLATIRWRVVIAMHLGTPASLSHRPVSLLSVQVNFPSASQI